MKAAAPLISMAVMMEKYEVLRDMEDDSLSVKLVTLADRPRPLPPDVQEDIFCLVTDVVRTIEKRL